MFVAEFYRFYRFVSLCSCFVALVESAHRQHVFGVVAQAAEWTVWQAVAVSVAAGWGSWLAACVVGKFAPAVGAAVLRGARLRFECGSAVGTKYPAHMLVSVAILWVSRRAHRRLPRS